MSGRPRLQRRTVQRVGVKGVFDMDYYRENGGVIFPNPNAPTGVAEPLSDIEDILEHNTDVIVIVDEAYVDFGARSAI